MNGACRYRYLYWVILVGCWISYGIASTAAGAWAAQWFPGSALLAVWLTVTAVLDIGGIAVSDRAAAWAWHSLSRERRGA